MSVTETTPQCGMNYVSTSRIEKNKKNEMPFVLVRLIKMRQIHAVLCVPAQNMRLYQPEIRIKPHESRISRGTDWFEADFRPK